MKQKATAIVQSLNERITDDLDTQTITTILNETMTNAFNSVDKTEQKKLYHALSLLVHPDKSHSAAFIKVLNEKGLNNLASTTLQTVWLNSQKNHINYNPFKYVENVQNHLQQINVTPEISNLATKVAKDGFESYADFLEARNIIDVEFKKHFPELYNYEQYPNLIQNIVYGFAMIVNAVIGASLFVKFNFQDIATLSHIIEVELLAYATNNHYASHEARVLAMKATLAAKQMVAPETDEDIREIFNTNYNLFSNAEKTQFETTLWQMRLAFTGLVHLNLVAKALNETWMEEASMMKRLTQGLCIVASLPFMAVGITWDTFSSLLYAACILLKATSVALINAPLDIKAYFTPEPVLQLTNSPANPEQKSRASMGKRGLFALQKKLQERPIDAIPAESMWSRMGMNFYTN